MFIFLFLALKLTPEIVFFIDRVCVFSHSKYVKAKILQTIHIYETNRIKYFGFRYLYHKLKKVISLQIDCDMEKLRFKRG